MGTGFGNQLPPIGTRVVFSVGLDSQKGQPTAENVQSEESFSVSGDVGSQVLSGTMFKASGNFGFIKQDNGEADMFVMPAQCDSFGQTLPPVGTRVTYEVSTDAKSGRLRAENVELESASVKGEAKGKARGKLGGC